MEVEWQKKLSKFGELLTEKDEQISRANAKRQACANTYVDTLVQTNDTQLAQRGKLQEGAFRADGEIREGAL